MPSTRATESTRPARRTTRRALLGACAGVVAALAGCVSDGGPPGGTDSSTGTSTREATDTPTPTAVPTDDRTTDGSETGTVGAGTPSYRPVDFPDGPKSPPAVPSTLTAESVRTFVRTHEYRYAYNELWMGEGTEVSLDCSVRRVGRIDDGWRAIVRCTGYANRQAAVPNGTSTATAVHADYFTQYWAYRVAEESVRRRRATETEAKRGFGSGTETGTPDRAIRA